MTRKQLGNREIPNVRTSSEEIANQLARMLFRKELPPGSKLPPERELATQFGVARNVVREAIKRLEATGAVRSWQGSGVYVQDIEFLRGISIFETLMRNDDGSVNVGFLRDVLEFRGYFMRLVVRLAAARRSDEELDAIKRFAKEWEAARGDRERQAEITHEIYRTCVAATHNGVCQALFKTVERVSGELVNLVTQSVPDFSQRRNAYERLIDAFEQKDSGMAELAVVRFIESIEMSLGLGKTPTGFIDTAS
jgi:GntR family transcriptional regulator, transcriptional repressor for pyruvate dehydrogenase complex